MDGQTRRVFDWVAVAGLTRQQVADRSGVAPEYIDRLVGLGALEPSPDGSFTQGDVRRARLYQGLELTGLSPDALIEPLGRGDISFGFLDSEVYDRFASLSPRSFREVSSSEGIPLELLLVVREAIGFAQADADDRMREDELGVLPIIKLQLSFGFDPALIEGWLRVYGETMQRITETEADWWNSQITTPMLATAQSEAETMEQAQALGLEFSPPMEEALLAFYHAHQEHAWTAVLIEIVEGSLERAGLRPKLDTDPAICFLDITGYTRLTERLGDVAAAQLASRLTPLVQRPAERHRGKVVKWLGDGVMFHFREPRGAVVAALEMLDAISTAGLPPAHVGVHTGPVVFQGGDYFGRTVNLAARIAEYAKPGQVLVTRDVVDSAGSGGVGFDEVGPVELKGVSEPVPLLTAHRL